MQNSLRHAPLSQLGRDGPHAKHSAWPTPLGDQPNAPRCGGFQLGRLKAKYLLAVFLTTATQASAQEVDRARTTGVDSLRRVEVTGTTNDQRREAIASTLVVTRKELDQFGDPSVADVLRRVPGVSVVGGGSKPQDIRILGLGDGYTKIFVNDEPVAEGFSIDSISPNLVERIEVRRSSTAEGSSQGIAGSIYITLRRPKADGRREIKVGQTIDAGIVTTDVSGQYSDQTAPLSRALALNLRYDKNRWPSSSLLDTRTSTGSPMSLSRVDILEGGERFILGATPRVSWNLGEQESLALDGLFQFTRLRYHWQLLGVTEYGTSPEFGRALTTSLTDTTQVQLGVNWKKQIDDRSRIDAKVQASASLRKNGFGVVGSPFGGDNILLLDRRVDARLQDRSLAISGKYSLSLNDSHVLAVGWVGRLGDHGESRTQRESTEADYPVSNFSESYDSTVRQLALFAQDEWTLNRRLSGYVGLRWEDVDSEILADAATRTQSRSSILSPTIQTIWKLSELKKDQFRLNLGRGYKLPTTIELIPRTRVVTFNSAATPDLRGNPILAPELSWNLDGAYERYFEGDGFLGVNAYVKKIRDVIVPLTFLGGSRWVSLPVNGGMATVRGIGVEFKGDLRQLAPEATPIRLRLGANRNWSKLHDVPGPDNRIRNQPRLTVTLGADYRVPGSPLAIGAAYSLERTGLIRLSSTQSTYYGDRRDFDMYAVWSVSARSKVRLTLLNVLRPTAESRTQYADGSLRQTQTVLSPSFRGIRVLFETDL